VRRTSADRQGRLTAPALLLRSWKNGL